MTTEKALAHVFSTMTNRQIDEATGHRAGYARQIKHQQKIGRLTSQRAEKLLTLLGYKSVTTWKK